MTFYEINQAMQECVVLDEETGEVVGIDTEKLEALQMDKAEKAINIARWIANLQSDATQLKLKKLQFAAWQKSCEDKVEALKTYLADNLDEDIKQDGVQLKLRTSYKAEPVSLDDIPEAFRRYKWEPDKVAALKTLKAGGEIPGFQLTESHTVSIKGV